MASLVGVDESLLLVIHEPHDDAVVAADDRRAPPDGPDDVFEIQALGELAARVEDLAQLDGMVADDLVTGLRGASGRGERTHHVVEPLPELPELTGTGGVHGRLQLSVANPDDVTQQRSYGSDNRIAQRTMLPDGQDEDRHEHRELERYTSRDELLIAPRQELAAPIERADENCFRAPISVEERFAFENRWSGAVGPQVGRSRAQRSRHVSSAKRVPSIAAASSGTEPAEAVRASLARASAPSARV